MEKDTVIELGEDVAKILQKEQESISLSTTAKQLYDSLPVEAETRCIRLLDLDAPKSREKRSKKMPSSLSLTGNLRVVSLDASPVFVSLSYVWGEIASPAHTVCCQGCELEITANCHEALTHIRKLFGPVAIWVDSICINQQDNAEKASQIPLMQEIYSMAGSVYIWLGPGDDGSDRAMEFFTARATLVRRIPLGVLGAGSKKQRRQESRRFRSRAWKDICGRFRKKRHEHKLVPWEQFLDREWAHRSWTFQELALARHPIILCGDKVLAWEDLVSAICWTRPSIYSYDACPLPDSSVVLTHWRSMVDLWLNIPRPQPTNNTSHKQKPSSTFKEQIATRWNRRGDLPLSLNVFSVASTSTIALSLLALWGFATYKAGVAGNAYIIAQGNNNLWLVGGFMWFSATLIVLVIMWDYFKSLIFVLRGYRHIWLVQEKEDSIPETDAVIDGIRGALRERLSSRPHDRAFALSGILGACGAFPAKPDYSRSVGETYMNLFQDLLTWRPSALILLLDAGGGKQADRSSWVPNWETKIPSQWLSSRYRLGVTENATPITGHPTVIPSGAELKVRGHAIGTVVFQTPWTYFDSVATGLDNDALRTILHNLGQWIHFIHSTSEARYKLRGQDGYNLKGYEKINSALFAVLEGLSPPRGPTVRRVTHSAEGGVGRDTYSAEPLAEWEGPYDYRDQKQDYFDFVDLFAIIRKSVRYTSQGSSLGISPPPDLRAMLAEVTGSERALRYLNRMLKRFASDKRRLLVLSSGLVGTGPLGMEHDDEVFLIAGVPSPMTLRRSPGEESFRVVGATLVHGLMRGEGFLAYKLGDVTLI